ncbi:hypothetical protein [Trinickia violacea]|nr:hypothetical protein [Trinickia violacea]
MVIVLRDCTQDGGLTLYALFGTTLPNRRLTSDSNVLELTGW